MFSISGYFCFLKFILSEIGCRMVIWKKRSKDKAPGKDAEGVRKVRSRKISNSFSDRLIEQ